MSQIYWLQIFPLMSAERSEVEAPQQNAESSLHMWNFSATGQRLSWHFAPKQLWISEGRCEQSFFPCQRLIRGWRVSQDLCLTCWNQDQPHLPGLVPLLSHTQELGGGGGDFIIPIVTLAHDGWRQLSQERPSFRVARSRNM